MSSVHTVPPSLLRGEKRSLPARGNHIGNKHWEGAFTFIQAADPQFGLIERYIEKRPPPIGWSQEIQLAEQAIECVNRMQPRPLFMIVCGDLVDAMPVTEDRDAQVATFFQVFNKLCPDIPLICVCGNHDVGDHPTVESVRIYTDKFGDDYFTFWVSGVKCIVINSQFYEDSSGCPQLREDQDKWLEEALHSSDNQQAKHVLLFQHIPWFVHTSNEPKEYFNIAEPLRQEMLTKFCRAGVTHIFCGHCHKNAGGWFEDPESGRRMELVVTSAIGGQLGDDKSGFRIVRVTDTSVEHEYQAF